MWQYLVPTALNALQEESNKNAQIQQDYINRKYSPWVNGSSREFSNQTNMGNTLSQGYGAYNAAQDEKQRRDEYSSLFSALVADDSTEQMRRNLFKQTQTKPVVDGMVNTSNDPSLRSAFQYLA
tara:strand:+ start:7048 stop:7419 length:372 start_codon:yes stop_codon:yes gene_type:complete